MKGNPLRTLVLPACMGPKPMGGGFADLILKAVVSGLEQCPFWPSLGCICDQIIMDFPMSPRLAFGLLDTKKDHRHVHFSGKRLQAEVHGRLLPHPLHPPRLFGVQRTLVHRQVLTALARPASSTIHEPTPASWAPAPCPALPRVRQYQLVIVKGIGQRLVHPHDRHRQRCPGCDRIALPIPVMTAGQQRTRCALSENGARAPRD